MFTTLLFNKNIKYIGYAIVFIMVAIPVFIMFDSLYTGTLHLFGGETKTEKITRLEQNNVVLKDSVESTKKQQEFNKKKSEVLTTVIVKSVTKKIAIDDKNKSIKKKLKKKLVKIVKKDEHVVTLTPKVAEEDVLIIKDKEVYEAVGVALSDAMFEMYDSLEEDS